MAIKWPEIQYREGTDGMMYPLLEPPQQPSGSIGKYGELRRNYLEKHRPATYQLLILNGDLKQHLMDMNEQVHEQIDSLIAAAENCTCAGQSNRPAGLGAAHEYAESAGRGNRCSGMDLCITLLQKHFGALPRSVFCFNGYFC